MNFNERGSVSLWLVMSTFVMMLLVGLAVDLGGHVQAKQRAHDIAAQAARAGGQEVQAAPAIEGRYLSVDARAARSAVQNYLDASGVHGVVSIDGGDSVTVTVTESYRPKFLVFLGDLHVTGEATARVVRSIGGNER